jgi:hypothetical protein
LRDIGGIYRPSRNFRRHPLPHPCLLMKVRLFVTGSSALLAVWLTATFLQDVPVDTYTQFGRGSVPLSAKAAKPAAKKDASVVVVDKAAGEVVPVATID